MDAKEKQPTENKTPSRISDRRQTRLGGHHTINQQPLFSHLQTSINKKRTKIIASIDSKNCKTEILRKYIDEGVDSFILYSDLVQFDIIQNMNKVRRELEDEFKKVFSVLITLQGHTTRTGPQINPSIKLQKGNLIRMVPDENIIGTENLMSINHPESIHELKQGDIIQYNFGAGILQVVKFEQFNETLEFLLELTGQSQVFSQITQEDLSQNVGNKGLNIEKHSADELKVAVCEIMNEFNLMPFKTLIRQVTSEQLIEQNKNQNNEIKIERIISQKDLKTMELLLENDLDGVIVKISNANELRKFKEMYSSRLLEKNIKIYARIENKQAIENLDEILVESDGIMLMRAFIAITIDVSQRFFIERDIIEKANSYLKPVFIANNILDSMMQSVIPNSAQCADIANLVFDHVDGVCLLKQITLGQYPIETLNTLSNIIVQSETYDLEKNLNTNGELFRAKKLVGSDSKNFANNLVSSGIDTAYHLKAQLILIITETGSSAIKVAQLKPPCSTLAICKTQQVARQLSLLHSVIPIILFEDSALSLIERSLQFAKARDLIKINDVIVVIVDQIKDTRSNFIKVIKLEK